MPDDEKTPQNPISEENLQNPTISSEQFLDSNKAFLAGLKARGVKLFLAFAAGIGWIFLCPKFLPDWILSSDLLGWIIMLPWLGIFGWIFFIYAGVREAFWKQIALKYGWEYQTYKSITGEKALLFGLGHSKIAHHGIIGKYGRQLFHIFEYQYSEGHGKGRRDFDFTVFEIEFYGTFPHLYLNYRGDWYSSPPKLFSSYVKLSTPAEFQDKFKLYVPKEYEIEALQIFTPDVFALLLNLGWNHDMEFVDGELVIYSKKKFTNFMDLDAELTKIKKFVDVLSPLLNKLKLTKIGDLSPMLGK